ncbi:hypothetical protein [Nocardiopsis synnemataformans]|uniref:hypothetical protein n=1 Tax=Nocardiopsis synnemataformans TaxID=61305 RepID=UPI003EB84537
MSRVTGNSGFVWAAVVVLVVVAALVVQTVRENSGHVCCAINPDLYLDVQRGEFGPPGAAVPARMEVVEVAALADRTRTTVSFVNEGEEPAEFDASYFTGDGGSTGGFRILDTADRRHYGVHPDLGGGTAGRYVWEPGVEYRIEVHSPPLEEGTDTVTVLAPHGTAWYHDVAVVDGAAPPSPPAHERPSWGEVVALPVREGAPRPLERDWVPLFWPEATERAPEAPVDEAGPSPTGDGQRFAEGGRVWDMWVDAVFDRDGFAVVRFQVTLVSGEPPRAGADGLPAPWELSVADPATGTVHHAVRAGDPEGTYRLSAFSWDSFTRAGQTLEGHVYVPGFDAGVERVDVDAGVFGVFTDRQVH